MLRALWKIERCSTSPLFSGRAWHIALSMSWESALRDAGKDVVKRVLLLAVVGEVNWCSYDGKQDGGSPLKGK